MKKENTTPAAPPLENTASDLIALRVKHSPVGLTFQQETTLEEWVKIHEVYSTFREQSRWWIGDSIRFAAEKFPDRYAQFAHITGKSYSRLTSYASVCEKIPIERRRQALSFDAHEAVAYIAYQEADRILDKAEKHGWGREEVRDAVCRAQGLPTKAERDAKKAEKAAAEAKKKQDSQPTIEAEATVTRIDLPKTEAKPQENAGPQPTGTGVTAGETAPTPPPAPEPKPQTDEEYAIECIEEFVLAFGKLDVKGMGVLKRKTWLKRLVPVDKFIDQLQEATPGAKRV